MSLTGRPMLLATALLVVSAGPAPAWSAAVASSPGIRLIGIAEIPRDAAADGIPIGGLSGIDYDPRTGEWYAISDDRSEHGPARFYRLQISYNHDRPPVVTMSTATPLHNEDSRTFPVQGTGAEASDAESIRAVPGTGDLIWSSEGDARDGYGPAVRRMAVDGASRGRVPLPMSFAFDPKGEHGPRPNLSIEGLSFTNQGRRLWLSLEAPLYQDGDLARASTGAVVRLTELAYPSGKVHRQLAYPVEPIGPYPAGRMADNGVSEILALDPRHLLVLERSGVQDMDGDFHFRTRVYCAHISGASNVTGLPSLQGQAYLPMRKTLAIDFSGFGERNIGNVEGMALGPVLSNGHASLVFVTDNDFSARRRTQVIAMEIIARPDPRAIARALCGR